MAAGDGEIMLGYAHNGTVRAEFMASMFQLRDSVAGRLIGAGASSSGGTLISYARNRLTEEFLASSCQWLFMVDTDMTFAPMNLLQLAVAGDPVERPIVSGICAILNKAGTGTIPNVFNAIRDSAGEVTGFGPVADLPDEGLVQVDGCGAAFLLIHRDVMEKIAPGEWFREGVTPSGGIRAEDLSFCMRATEAGFSIWAHCGCRPGHMKTVCVTVDLKGET